MSDGLKSLDESVNGTHELHYVYSWLHGTYSNVALAMNQSSTHISISSTSTSSSQSPLHDVAQYAGSPFCLDEL